MANRLVRIRQVSTATSTPDAGAGMVQINPMTVTGLTDGSGLCVDKSGSVYVCDSSKHVIYRIRPGGASKIFAGTYGVSGSTDGAAGAAKFNGPTGIACDSRGFLFVMDSGNALIRRIDDNANVYTVAKVPALGSDEPGGIAVNDSGDIFIIDNTA